MQNQMDSDVDVDHDKDVNDDNIATGTAQMQSSWRNGSLVDVDHDVDDHNKDFDDNEDVTWTGRVQTQSSWRNGSVATPRISSPQLSLRTSPTLHWYNIDLISSGIINMR